MNQRVGRSSIRLEQPVCVIAGAAIVGKKEGEGPLGALFDMVGEDDLFGCKTWEEAERCSLHGHGKGRVESRGCLVSFRR